jgi:hypothetical protein
MLNCMRSSAPALASVGLCWMVMATWPSAYAIERGSTGAGIAYVSGGVGQSELVALSEEKKTTVSG